MFDAHQEDRNVGSGFYSKPLRFFYIEILLISFSQTCLQDFNERLSFLMIVLPINVCLFQ